jgi:hypothetical protein
MSSSEQLNQIPPVVNADVNSSAKSAKAKAGAAAPSAYPLEVTANTFTPIALASSAFQPN